MNSNTKEGSGEQTMGGPGGYDAGPLVRRIVSEARLGAPRVSFLREVTALLLEHSGCDLIALKLAEDSRCSRCRAGSGPEGFFEYIDRKTLREKLKNIEHPKK